MVVFLLRYLKRDLEAWRQSNESSPLHSTCEHGQIVECFTITHMYYLRCKEEDLLHDRGFLEEKQVVCFSKNEKKTVQNIGLQYSGPHMRKIVSIKQWSSKPHVTTMSQPNILNYENDNEDSEWHNPRLIKHKRAAWLAELQ